MSKDVAHHVTELSQTQILYSFYLQVLSVSYLHYSVSVPICIYSFMLLSAFICTFLFLVTIYLFSFHPSYFTFTIFDSRSFQILIFYLYFYLCIWFHWYSIYLITLFVDTTIYSSILIIDSAFILLTSLCYIITWAHIYLD